MADKVTMKATRQFLRTGGLVQAGESFAATEEEARRYERAKNPLAERVGGASADGDTDEIDATDAARKLAEEHGIDLASVKGTGADGRITVDDVKDALPDEE